jgi:hypothetical protein
MWEERRCGEWVRNVGSERDAWIEREKIQEKMYSKFSLSKNHSGNGDFFY